jgi:hypothetical protein
LAFKAKRLTFLPLFFIALAVILAIAIGVRIHSYPNAPSPIAARETEGAGSSAASFTADRAASEGGSQSIIVPPAGQQSPDAALAAAADGRRKRLAAELARPLGGETPKPSTTTAARIVVPPRPVPPRPPAPSMLQRLVAPIVRAFTPGPAGGGSTTAPQTPDKPKSPKDFSSDTTPPTLVSIQFTPPAIHDKEESTVTMVVTDDLSGVRNISASISSPSGRALRAFPFQKGEGDLWIGKVLVPEKAEEGIWRMTFLTMTDNANNTASLTWGTGIPATAVLRVSSSASDSTPPTVRSVYLDKAAISEGEHNTIFVEAVDDSSGVAMISGVFISPSKSARIGFGCRAPEAGDVWECDVVLPKCVDCGVWQLEQLQLQDKANNQAVIRNTDPLIAKVAFSTSGASCDSTPPSVQSVSVQPQALSNLAAGIITITAIITDDLCGVQPNASAQIVGPPIAGQQPQSIFFPLSVLPDNSTMFVGRAVLPKSSAKGTWRLNWLQISDKANNLRTYSANDPMLFGVRFEVQ